MKGLNGGKFTIFIPDVPKSTPVSKIAKIGLSNLSQNALLDLFCQYSKIYLKIINETYDDESLAPLR